MAILEEAIWSFCHGIAADPRRGKRILIYGNNGCGKSRSLRAVKTWIKDRAIDLPLVMGEEGSCLVDCVFVHWPSAAKRFKGGDWEIDDMLNATVLILDDIGAELDTAAKAVANQLYLILERREFRWTLISTNFPPDQWEEQWGRRIADRLFRNCEHFDVSKIPSYSINT